MPASGQQLQFDNELHGAALVSAAFRAVTAPMIFLDAAFCSGVGVSIS
jgi:hypothetical protein